jgi:selenocysteine lyase/cysteine desulfurase
MTASAVHSTPPSRRIADSPWRSAWAPFGDVAYLNTAAMSAMPRASLEAVHAAIGAKRFPHTRTDAEWFEVAGRLRTSLARLIGVRTEDIALTTGASTGLQAVALGLAWQPGDEVVIAAGEFPLQYATWMPMAQREGVTIKVVTPRGPFLSADDLIDALTPRTRVLSVSHVRFDDGTLLDTSRVAAACRTLGVLFVLDVTQSCGAVPMNVAALGADVVVSAGYKWLLSPYGTGFLWTTPAQLAKFRPAPFYWMAQDVTSFGALDMRTPAPAPSAKRFDAAETSSWYNFNLVAMEASVRVVCEFGPDTVLAHTRALIDHLFAHLPSHLSPASPRDATQRGPFGSFVAASPERTDALYQRLTAAQVYVSKREGRIRVSPHLFNTQRDIDRLLDVLVAS